MDRPGGLLAIPACAAELQPKTVERSEEHTSELQSLRHLVCRLLLEKKQIKAETRTLAAAPAVRRSALGPPRAPPRRRVIAVPPRSTPPPSCSSISCFFFNDTATTEIYTLSLHDALPISEVASTDNEDRAELPCASRSGCP